VAAWSIVVVIASGGITLIATGHAIGGLVALVTELASLALVFMGRQVIQSRGSSRKPHDDKQTPSA
jgi:Ca2+/Na+ antiporter